MSYQVLARKWRPKNFQEVVGQEPVVQALVNGLDNDRVHHAFLLTGTRGVGKTTLARILAKSLNCETGVSSTPCGQCRSCLDVDEGRFVDMIEIDAASRTGVDDIRDLIESAQYAPTRGRFKVYIIDEVHMLSTSAFNALLKTLEEPPPHVKFVLATTDAEKIPVTILSRCLRFNLRRLLPDQIGAYLRKITESEDVDADAAAITRIARAADGSMRDGLSLLDQAIAYGGGALRDEEVADMLGSVDHGHLATLLSCVVAEDGRGVLEGVQALAAESRDLQSVLTGMAEVLHRVCLVHCVPDYRDRERSDWESIAELAAQVSAEDAQLFYQIAIQGARDLGLAPDPRTGLEMALLRMLAFRPAGTPVAGAAPGGSSSALEKAPASAAGTDADPAEPSLFQPASAPEATPVSVAAGAGAGADTDDWSSLLEGLDLTGPVRELARNITLDKRDDGRWRFLIPETVRHYGSPALVRKLQAVLSERLGHSVVVELRTAARQVSTPATVAEEASRQARSDAELEIAQDETVQSLRERMGAVVAEDSIQPLQ